MLALGVFPDVSLAEARKDRDDAKRKLRDRIDTMAERQATKLHEKRSAADPFKAVAEEWMEKQRGCWTAGHAEQVFISPTRYNYAALGQKDLPAFFAKRPKVRLLSRATATREACDKADLH